MRTSVHHDVALPALALTHIVKDRDPAWRLYDPAEAATAISGAKLGQARSEAPVCQGTIFGIVMAVHPRGVVARRSIRTSWRGCGIVFAAAARRQFRLAGFCRLQQSEAKTLIGGGNFLSICRYGRNAAVGRI